MRPLKVCVKSYNTSPCACFVKELRRKNLRGYARKIFRALDNDETLTIKTRAERFPAPRLNHPIHAVSRNVIL